MSVCDTAMVELRGLGQRSRVVARTAGRVLLVVGVLFGSISAVVIAGRAAAGEVCTVVKVIGVRGSGENDDPRRLGNLLGPLYDQLRTQMKRPRDLSYIGLHYPARSVDWTVFESYNATYQVSKNRGRDTLRQFMRDEASVCPNEQVIVFGYSQGAQVVGDVFSKKVGRLGSRVLAQVVAVELFGDPRFNSRESFDRGSYRVGRNGILGARSPGDLSAVAQVTRSWCRTDDIVCQGPGSVAEHDAAKYLSEYGADAIRFLTSKIGNAQLRTQLPTLGRVWGSDQEGYGTVRPATIFNGGDPTGLVTEVHWQSWGGHRAIGKGTSDHVEVSGCGSAPIESPSCQTVAGGTQELATVVAFDRGICRGMLMYQAIEWYFPQHGEVFDPHQYIDICTGEYVPQ